MPVNRPEAEQYRQHMAANQICSILTPKGAATPSTDSFLVLVRDPENSTPLPPMAEMELDAAGG